MKSRTTFYFLLAVIILVLAAVAGINIFRTPANQPAEIVPVIPEPDNEIAGDNPAEDGDIEDLKEFAMAGISLENPAKRVLDLYGEPLSQKTQSEPSIHNPDYTCYWTTWAYDGFEVLFMKVLEKGKLPAGEIGEVFSIKVTVGEYETLRGIQVGDPASRVVAQYGTDENAYFSQGEEELFFEKGLNYIRFAVSEGKVNAIEVGQMLN